MNHFLTHKCAERESYVLLKRLAEGEDLNSIFGNKPCAEVTDTLDLMRSTQVKQQSETSLAMLTEVLEVDLTTFNFL